MKNALESRLPIDNHSLLRIMIGCFYIWCLLLLLAPFAILGQPGFNDGGSQSVLREPLASDRKTGYPGQ